MSEALLISVRLHDGRYHGRGDWPPSPARLFQALVAGAGLSGPIDKNHSEALRWLERKCESAPPIIGAPISHGGQRITFYMPNNDLDRVGGDPQRTAEIRTATKIFKPYLFDASVPFLYAWLLSGGEGHQAHAGVICSFAERIYQFGRGVDMAWAHGQLLDASEFQQIVSDYPGRIYRSSRTTSAINLLCPSTASYTSLMIRYQAYSRRFGIAGNGKRIVQIFSKPPKPRFRLTAYDSPSSQLVYDLRVPSSLAPFAAWQLAKVVELVERLRDAAVDRLHQALPSQKGDIDRALVGRKPDGSNDGPIDARVRIVPLPSIGYVHADRAVRRMLVEVPASCPLRAEDVQWAFSSLELVDKNTGEVLAILTPAAELNMLVHYGIGDGVASRSWRSVTPLALPETAARRRIEPTRKMEEAKNASERIAEQSRAGAAVMNALRHAEVHQRPEAIRVQREPFEANGERVETFAEGTRFRKERLWHVAITFGAPVSGPLVLGDGRFLGLGVMTPLTKTQGLHAFGVQSGLVSIAEPTVVARALRRAVMARIQDLLDPSDALPAFFSGHERDGSPAAASHLAYVFDPRTARLLIIAPHLLDRRLPTSDEKRWLSKLDEVLLPFHELRAGSAGQLTLQPLWIDVETDSVTAPSRTWESVTSYLVTRHAKQGSAAEALASDLRTECRRRGLPEPLDVATIESRGVPDLGLIGRARLTFAVAVRGPILLGKSRYCGGGLFAPSSGA
jgi:CRISPR-associated protein Csb2